MPSHLTREALNSFVEKLPITAADKAKFSKLLAAHEKADADGLREDFESLEHDAAEVVLQWQQGSVGLLDEACGKLRDNGRPGWWVEALRK